MDIFTALRPNTRYSAAELQIILGAWVLSGALDRGKKVSLENGDVSEDDYTKQSIYALLYSVYQAVGTVQSNGGEPYEFTFNTWGYDWPEKWGRPPVAESDPQRFGKFAYSGLFAFSEVKEYAAAHKGKLHVVEMGSGTGAGADHVCEVVLPGCTYTAVDMQRAAFETCKRKFVPRHNGRLRAVHGDITEVDLERSSADFVAICETHVTEHAGEVTPEDQAVFDRVLGTLRPGGFLVWGNAIPDLTWQPCFDHLARIGMEQVEVRDVTDYAVRARDLDKERAESYVQQCLDGFYGFRIPILGARRRREAEQALKNFFRHPGTNLYENMKRGIDSYRVALFRKPL
jgi:SAM-dependent methyltransferase